MIKEEKEISYDMMGLRVGNGNHKVVIGKWLIANKRKTKMKIRSILLLFFLIFFIISLS